MSNCICFVVVWKLNTPLHCVSSLMRQWQHKVSRWAWLALTDTNMCFTLAKWVSEWDLYIVLILTSGSQQFRSKPKVWHYCNNNPTVPHNCSRQKLHVHNQWCYGFTNTNHLYSLRHKSCFYNPRNLITYSSYTGIKQNKSLPVSLNFFSSIPL